MILPCKINLSKQPALSWAPLDLTPPFFRSPQRSSTVLLFRLPRKDPGTTRLTSVSYPLQITCLPNPRIDEPVRAVGTNHAN